jgi:hypothetical protein
MSDRIIKLVFIRAKGSDAARKAVVPLVEGCAFDQFLVRVRRRLGASDSAQVSLSDAATGPVDSIDRLLEVDEGNTLDVDVVCASPFVGSCSTPGSCTPSSLRGPAQRAPRSSDLHGDLISSSGHELGVPPTPMPAPEVRLDVPTSEWSTAGHDHEDDSGALKYRKRRRVGSKRTMCFLLLGLGVGLCTLRMFFLEAAA